MKSMITLSVISLLALATSGCGNQLDKPSPGPTPQSVNPATPAYGTAGGPLVPGNNPNAGSTLPPTQPGGADAPLTPPNTPGATPNPNSTQTKQEKSGYFPNADTPLVPPSSTTH
ncbi:MAG TPA: hypothetical protein VLX85_14385 [Stellaceae bacterium]|nr:hypothetical protein [Stellaceae bacterium]